MKFLVFLVCVGFVLAEIKEEKDVLVLTEANFEEAVNDKTSVLVEFCKCCLVTQVFLFQFIFLLVFCSGN